MATYAETSTTTNGAPESDGYTTAEARIDLAAAHRLCVYDNLHEGTWNHISLNDPEDPSKILISPSYVHWSQVTASSLERLGANDQAAKRDLALWTAYRIHWPLHEARPDAKCVLHVHSPHVVALAMTDVKLNQAEQNALEFWGKTAYTDEYDGLWKDDLEQGQRMADALGERNTLLMLRGHGAIVVGETVGLAYARVYMLERAARTQILAMSTGHPVLNISDAELEKSFSREWVPVDHKSSYLDEHFNAMKRVLDREQPDYRD
jgi:ribulose-5-phosphate 4-epimerase/fuculose-1-phosphate aldolase